MAVETTNEALEVIKGKFADLNPEITAAGEVKIEVPVKRYLEVCQFLKAQDGLAMNVLHNLTAVDYPQYVEVVCHIFRLFSNLKVVVKVKVPKDNCQVPSVTSLWDSANWFEREVYDLFGVTFTGHPDLRRILMPEGFTDYPLRKDFVDKRPERPRQVRH